MLRWVKYILDGEEGQITVRHLFYRLVGHGVIPKTEAAYKAMGKHLSNWRRAGEVQWNAFSDNTRWHLKADTFDSMVDALANTVATYRRNLWESQPVYIEVWCEKDAVASILHQAAEPFGVPVFVSRGFASLSSLYSAAETFRGWAQAGKRVIIYHFGDFDPSGVAAGDSILRTFRDDFKLAIEFTRVAVTQEQIREFNLPTRPTKATDSRAAKWTGGDSVEIDSMPPAELRRLVETCITSHIDQRAWEVMKEVERGERENLRSIHQFWSFATR